MSNAWPLVERRRNDRRTSDRRQPKIPSTCTPRERQVLALLLRGMTNRQIAQTLGIEEDTVKKHLQHVYDKLEVRRRALVMIAVPAHSSAGTPSVE
jgi:DNA-binding NarL/FixJ family response regulator